MAALWLTIMIAGLLTFLTRLSFIALFGRWQPPGWLKRALRFVPPAVLSAIIFPEVLARDGVVVMSAENFRLVAALVAALVAWRTRNVILTIGSGMAVLYLLQWLW